MPRRLLWIVMSALLTWAPLAAARAEQPLFVELVVNGRPTGEIVALRQTGEDLFIARETLRAAGVTIAGEGEADLIRTPGLTARYDSAMLRLEVEADPALLPLHRIDPVARLRTPTRADVGALVNYDLYALSADNTSASLWSEQRLFGPPGLISNNGVLRSAPGAHGGGYLRYDTYASRIDEERAIAYTAGDLITHALPWSRSVRLGGFQVSRAFRVRPDLVTMPLPSFAGQAALPSTVDLFVNGYRQAGLDVAPGRFVLDSVPVVTGAGQATIVTTDAVGRQISTTIPFYVTPELMRPGLADFSLEAGWLRRGYGVSSFDYGAAAASGSLRYGLSNRLTIEAHGEAAGDLTLLGAGFVWSPGRIGAFTGSAAVSRGGEAEGARWAAGYAYVSARFSIAYQHERREAGFRDLGDIGAGPPPSGRTIDRFVGRTDFGEAGSLAVAYIAGEVLSGPRTRLASATYQRPIGRRATLSVTVDRDVERRATGGHIRLILPLGRSAASTGISRIDDRTLGEAHFGRARPPQGGVGFEAALASDQRGEAYGQGSLTWRTRLAELQAGGAFAAGRSSSWFSASGALVAMDREVFAANRVSDAFAVVKTGAPGVTVFYENQEVGATNAHGRLFVPQVTSYQSGAFAIDTLSLSESYVAPSVQTQAAMRAGAGAVVGMPVRRVRSVIVVLVDADGAPLTPGAQVERSDGAPAAVGWDGIVYLEEVGDHIDLSVTRRDGGVCRATLAVPANVAPLAKLGPTPCV